MNEGEIIEVEPIYEDDIILKIFEKVWYDNASTYAKIFFSKSSIMIVPTTSLGGLLLFGFPGLAYDSIKGHMIKNKLGEPFTMEDIIKKIDNPIYIEKKNINQITMKKSLMVIMVNIELQPTIGLFGKPKKNIKRLSFFKKNYTDLNYTLNTYFKDRLVLI